MGSPDPSAGAEPQHALLQHPSSPACTRRAAPAYFSRTTSLRSMAAASRFRLSVLPNLRAHPGDFPGVHRTTSGAALGIEEPQKPTERLSVRRIPQIGALSADRHQSFVLQFF